ncbi:MAG TPA: permease [Xanthobacteraceae bacterium]|nr:permease [Xanthobacteraceae bacterium]
MTTPASLTWFAAHELRVSWRDWLSMMTAGRRWRARSVAIALVAVGVVMHVIAYAMVGPYAATAGAGEVPVATLVTITGCALLSWSLMASQAMESVTRAFYTRSDLDLILSSPVAAQRLFAVRIATMAGGITLMSVLLAAPFINMLALRGGAHWLAAYAVAAAMGATAAAFAVALTVALFRLIGPKRTRLIAQIVAAVIGAGFVIGLQLGAIVSYGTLSRTAYLSSSALVALAPGVDSPLWWPARAMLGDLHAFAAVTTASLALLLAAIAVFSRSFGAHAVAAQSIGQGMGSGTARAHRAGGFRAGSAKRALRRKEWVLLRRDPWLVSQTLMQLLYLLPPAFMLWRSFGDGASALVLLVPVLVMGSGQLAGGLAWLAISGEDAPDLVATAPVAPRAIMQAKIEAVLGAVLLVFAPFLVGLALAAPYEGSVAAVGVALAASSATAVQFWFRAQAKRSHFRRRQTSSRMATIAEAFASITWAATAALAAAGLSIAVLPAVCAVAVLALARWMRPR